MCIMWKKNSRTENSDNWIKNSISGCKRKLTLPKRGLLSNLLLKQSMELGNEYPSWRTETEKIKKRELHLIKIMREKRICRSQIQRDT